MSDFVGLWVGGTLLVAGLVAGCRRAPEAPVFVRGGVVGPEIEGRAVGGGRAFLERAWAPREPLTVGSGRWEAPPHPECATLFEVPLGDVSRPLARGGTAPDTAIAVAPDGATLAIGTFRGEIWVVDAWTGALRVRRAWPEAVVKTLAFSRDGKTLFAGEQSPGAWLRALDARTLEEKWSLELADRVGRSPAPAGDDLYGVYTLPAVMSLDLLADGGLLVAATHGWMEEGQRRNLSQLLRLDASGTVRATWPPAPASITLWHPAVDAEAGRVAIHVGRSAAGPPPADLGVGAIALLGLGDLREVGRFEAPPLSPWYATTTVWEGLGLSGDTLSAGLADGRLVIHTPDAESVILHLGTPKSEDEVPLAATIGQSTLSGEEVLTLTSGTSIPYGAADPSLQPPSVHPNENTLWSHTLNGTLRWNWRGPYAPAGFAVSPGGREVAVFAGLRRGDAREDLFGAIFLDLQEEGSGEERVVTTCATQGPLFFRGLLLDDRRLFAVEHPFLRADGTLVGQYRLLALR